jgi:hypothetical protein
MPNVRRFLDEAVLFADTRCYLPAATDMNHLNAIAGTSSAQTGIHSVSIQPYNWNPDGTIRLEHTSMSWARDDQGRPVDTLFNAWKRRWPDAGSFFVTGKYWVGEMLRAPGTDVDIIVTGGNYPGYITAPEPYNFCDPPGDEDGRTDPESLFQVIGANLFLRNPAHFPCDQWIVDAALKVLSRENPDIGVILLAQLDDTQHVFGSVSAPGEFEPCGNIFCEAASRRNPFLYREPILDAAREVDRQFGRLMQGLKEIPYYRDATVILYSDHGHINHLFNDDWGRSADPTRILFEEGLLTPAERDGNGFAALGLCSMCTINWKADTLEERRQRAREAKEVLTRLELTNPETAESECPWHVLSHEEMIQGLPGVAAPQELWHPYFGPKNEPDSLLWPDLILAGRNGWQIPVTPVQMAGVGVELPETLPPINIFQGGHGSPDTQSIVMAMSGPGIARDKVVADPGSRGDYRIADLGVTIAQIYGLRLQSTTVGRDRSGDLA